jgi:predicted RNA binding protein YcfA (HicA-like mRNA interferase family)
LKNQYTNLEIKTEAGVWSMQIDSLKTNWEHIATDGSHWQFKHLKKKGRVTVPHPKKSLGIKTIKSIIRQAGLTLKEFEKCLK